MSVTSYDYCKLQWGNGVDAGSSATITAIPAPSAGFRILIQSYKLNVQAQDTVVVKSASTVKDTHYLSAYGGYDRDFGVDPLVLGDGEAFVITKTAATVLSWSAHYQVVAS